MVRQGISFDEMLDLICQLRICIDAGGSDSCLIELLSDYIEVDS